MPRRTRTPLVSGHRDLLARRCLTCCRARPAATASGALVAWHHMAPLLAPPAEVPVGGSTDLVVALANAGSTMFNVSHIEGKLTTSTGKTVKELPRYEYGQNLGPREQRSFRFPVPIDAEMPLGEYTLVAQAYYSTHKKKEPFVSAVLNEPIELVPPLPDKEAQMMRAIQLGLAALAISLLGLAVTRIFGGGSGASGKPGKKAASKEGSDPKTENEWLAGTLAGTENRGQRKAKKKA